VIKSGGLFYLQTFQITLLWLQLWYEHRFRQFYHCYGPGGRGATLWGRCHNRAWHLRVAPSVHRFCDYLELHFFTSWCHSYLFSLAYRRIRCYIEGSNRFASRSWGQLSRTKLRLGYLDALACRRQHKAAYTYYSLLSFARFWRRRSGTHHLCRWFFTGRTKT